MTAPSGVKIGVDVGAVRVGVARSDSGGTLAVPVTTLRRDHGDLDALAALVAEHQAVEVVVGLPVRLSGGEGPAAAATREYAARLAARVAPVPVRMIDERLTTVQADRALLAAGRPGGARARRTVVDQQAAALILQAALDADRVREGC